MHIDALLGRQAGVLSRAQALEFLDPKTLSRRVGREWQAPHRRVVVTHNGPLTPDQRDWATLLAAPEGSALWGGSAARWDGFTDRYSDETVHVVQRVGSRRLAIPWVQVHWSSELSEADINGLAVPRRTRISRSLLDLASDARTERGAQAIIFMGLQQRLLTADAFRQALGRRGPCRHHAVIEESLNDADGGIQSVPEKDFDNIIRRHGLPVPTRQVVVQRRDGRHYLDVLWRRYCLCAEVDGVQHRNADQWEQDLDRGADIVGDGLRQIRFSSFSVRRRGEIVGARLARALKSGGWDGISRS